MKFELYEKYLAEQQASAIKGGILQSRIVESQSNYDELTRQYEVAMVESIKSGKDITKVLNILDEKIDKARKDKERALLEYNVYGKVKRNVSITKENIIEAWNNELNPKYYEIKVEPALEKLKSAKQTYYEAMCEYFDTIHEIEDFREEVSSQLGFDFPYHFHIKNIQTTVEYDQYFIRQHEINKAESRNR